MSLSVSICICVSVSVFESVSVRTLNNILLRHICIYHKIFRSVPLPYHDITSSYVLECLGISDDWPDESMRT